MIRLSRFSLSPACMAVMVGTLAARDRHKALPPQDQIEVVAHLALRGDAVSRFLVTQHYRRDYLYAISSSGKAVTLIDVTDIGKPSVLADVTPSLVGADLVTAAGTAALISDSGSSTDAATGGPAANPLSKPQTLRIMNFADPARPVVSQQFTNVSAIGRDGKRGLIFLANAEGLWILHEELAVNPEFEKEWEHMMLDNR